jgi:hypothetical protein
MAKVVPTFKFEASPKEAKGIASFNKKHTACQETHGVVEIVLVQTGIGVAVHLRCTECGVEEDATDFSTW